MKIMIKWSTIVIVIIIVHMILVTNSVLHRDVFYDDRYYDAVYYCDELSWSPWLNCIIRNFTDTDPDIGMSDVYFLYEQNDFGEQFDYDELYFRNKRNFKEIRFISCNFSKSSIIIFTHALNDNIFLVDLSESNIRELIKFQFPNVRNLRKLVLSRNKIEKLVEPSIFSDHSTLTLIDLSFNRIRVIGSEAFNGLPNLEKLYLNNNEIKDIDGQMFGHIYALSMLDLSSNQIETVQNDSFVALENLMNLHLEENKFEKFDLNDLKYTAKLNDLYFGNNSDFTSLSGDLHFRDTYFEWSTLNISKVVSANFAVNCSSVFMTNSKISILKLGRKINIIHANNCSLTEVTFDNENSELMIVDFSRNNLSGDLKFENLTNLHTLDVSFNQITNISFVNSSALINLNLSKNNLTNIQSLFAMSKLKKLDLSENCILNFQLDTFANMDNLEVLVLRKTCFKSLDFGTFSYQKNLKVLDISYNNLNRIDINLFSSQSKLEAFFIDGNNLTDIQSIHSISFHLPNLHSIALSRNEWSCTTLISIIKILNLSKINVFVENIVQNKTNIKGIGCSTVSLNSTQQSIVTPENPMLLNHTMYINKIEKVNEIVEKINEMNNRRNEREFADNQLSQEIIHLKNRKIEIRKKIDNEIDDMNEAAKEILNKFKLTIEGAYNQSLNMKAILKKINDTNNEKYELLFKRIDSLKDRLKLIKLNDDVTSKDEFNDYDKNVINFNSEYHDDVESIKSLEIYSIVFLFLLIIFALYYAWFKC